MLIKVECTVLVDVPSDLPGNLRVHARSAVMEGLGSMPDQILDFNVIDAYGIDDEKAADEFEEFGADWDEANGQFGMGA